MPSQLSRSTIRHIRKLSPELRTSLIRDLASPDDVRADAIRQMYENPKSRPLAETLMDVEADDALRYEMTVTLKSFGPRDL